MGRYGKLMWWLQVVALFSHCQSVFALSRKIHNIGHGDKCTRPHVQNQDFRPTHRIGFAWPRWTGIFEMCCVVLCDLACVANRNGCYSEGTEREKEGDEGCGMGWDGLSCYGPGPCPVEEERKN